MSETASPSSALRVLSRDRILQLCVFVYALTLAVIAIAHAAPESAAAAIQQLTDPVLVAMTLITLLWGRSRIEQPERRFWDMLALAWACWLLVDGFYFFDVSLPVLSASVTTDALYILFYLVFALAVDLSPHLETERSPQTARRRLESIAGLMTVFGILIYFSIVVLPEPLGLSLSFVPRDRGVTPLLLVRLSLDLVLLGRLANSAFRARPRWRRLYTLLSIAMLCFALKDALAILVSRELLSPARLGLSYELFLSLPSFFVILAARYRHLPDFETVEIDVATNGRSGRQVFRTSPLVLYGMTLPALHFLLYPLGLLDPTSRTVREIFSLFFILSIGVIGWIHQSMIVKDGHRASEALRKAEERLFRSQRLESVGRLAGGIAHDFNNYLTVIRGYSELLRQRLHDPKMRKDIGFVEEAAGMATHLTRQLLAFGRRQVLRPESLDMNAVVLETSKLFNSLLGEDVILQLDLDPKIGHARADLGQTEQVLMNLALNGRDAMPRGGTLTVRTRRAELDDREAADLDLESGSYIQLTVTDTGCGMSEEVLAQVFEPFFTTKEQGRGTGLGLSTVHGIAAQSGGGISIESTLGAGTSIHVLFPIADHDVRAASATASRSPRAATDATLLVVEDNDQVRSLAVRALKHSGFRVHEASGGPAALEHLAEYEPIDMLITDVMMADMDGVELADILVSRCPGLRVLFISGYPVDTLQEREAVLPPSIQLLEKPFTAATLTSKVNEVLAGDVVASKN